MWWTSNDLCKSSLFFRLQLYKYFKIQSCRQKAFNLVSSFKMFAPLSCFRVNTISRIGFFILHAFLNWLKKITYRILVEKPSKTILNIVRFTSRHPFIFLQLRNEENGILSIAPNAVFYLPFPPYDLHYSELGPISFFVSHDH